VAVCGLAVLVFGSVAPAAAAELKAQTVAAFDRYVRVTEAQMETASFLRVDGLPERQRRMALEALRRGENLIERPVTRDAGREIDAPGGLIHHWVGTAFAPGATVDQALALLQRYDAHAEVYAPNVARARLLERDGDRFRVFLRFSMKKVITVVVNSEHVALFTRATRNQAEGRIRSTRIAEVENPDTPNEREKPVGQDGGYLWRLTTYWRLLARDGGVYIQCESISLTRGIPTGLGWLVGPFVTSIPRESLAFTLDTTRNRLASQR
jgi:hypothetical protein